jgi:hypothetical protein
MAVACACAGAPGKLKVVNAIQTAKKSRASAEQAALQPDDRLTCCSDIKFALNPSKSAALPLPGHDKY